MTGGGLITPSPLPLLTAAANGLFGGGGGGGGGGGKDGGTLVGFGREGAGRFFGVSLSCRERYKISGDQTAMLVCLSVYHT